MFSEFAPLKSCLTWIWARFAVTGVKKYCVLSSRLGYQIPQQELEWMLMRGRRLWVADFRLSKHYYAYEQLQLEKTFITAALGSADKPRYI